MERKRVTLSSKLKALGFLGEEKPLDYDLAIHKALDELNSWRAFHMRTMPDTANRLKLFPTEWEDD